MDSPFKTSADPALLDLFRAETDTHIPALSEGLLLLEKGQGDDQTIAKMMRAAHSIKGAARIVGLHAAVQVAHVMEDCFTAAKTNVSLLSSAAVDVLLQGVDGLQRICAQDDNEGLTGDWLQSLTRQLESVKSGNLAAPSRSQLPAQPPVPEVASSSLIEHQRTEVRFVLPAHFDAQAAEMLRSDICNAVKEHTPSIWLDFAHQSQINALELACLASLAKARRSDATMNLHVVGLSDELRDLFRVSGLHRDLVMDT